MKWGGRGGGAGTPHHTVLTNAPPFAVPGGGRDAGRGGQLLRRRAPECPVCGGPENPGTVEKPYQGGREGGAPPPRPPPDPPPRGGGGGGGGGSDPSLPPNRKNISIFSET